MVNVDRKLNGKEVVAITMHYERLFAEAAAEFDMRFELRPESAYIIASQAHRCFMQAGDGRAANTYTRHLAMLMKARNLIHRINRREH